MATLYEIEQSIMDCVDMETGEIIDIEKLDALRLEKEEKIENIALWIKNLKADAAAYKAEKAVFNAKMQAAQNKADSLTRYLEAILSGEKFKTSKVTVSYRSSQKVVVDDVDSVPEAYVTYEPKVDKTSIKDLLKSGATVDGVHLEECQNIQIR